MVPKKHAYLRLLEPLELDMQVVSQSNKCVKEKHWGTIENILSCTFVKISNALLYLIKSICFGVRYVQYR